MSRKEGGRGLASIEDLFDAWIQRLEDFIKSAEEDQLLCPERIQITQVSIEKQFEKMERKQMYGHFKQQKSEISHEKTLTWLTKGNLK